LKTNVFSFIARDLSWGTFIRRGGVASDIASIIQEEAFDYLDAPIAIVAGKNTPIPFSKSLEQASIPQEQDIIEAVKRVVYA